MAGALEFLRRKTTKATGEGHDVMNSPNEHSSPIRWGLKQASLLWYDL